MKLDSKGSRAQKPKREAEIREHLANERTLLAWVRTGVGLISVGFVVERAGALVNQVGNTVWVSEAFGLALVALGCLALAVGAVHFLRNRRMIRQGVFVASSFPYMIVVVGSLALAIAFIIYSLLAP